MFHEINIFEDNKITVRKQIIKIIEIEGIVLLKTFIIIWIQIRKTKVDITYF